MKYYMRITSLIIGWVPYAKLSPYFILNSGNDETFFMGYCLAFNQTLSNALSSCFGFVPQAATVWVIELVLGFSQGPVLVTSIYVNNGIGTPELINLSKKE